MNDTKSLPALPDRLSVNPNSPHHVAEIFEHNIGILLNGKERTDVEEYCISEGWVKIASLKALDRFIVNPFSIPVTSIAKIEVKRNRVKWRGFIFNLIFDLHGFF